MVASLSLSWGQCLLLLVHVDEHALAIFHTQLPRITKSYEKNLPCSQTKLTPKTTVIDIGSNGTGKNENITGVESDRRVSTYHIFQKQVFQIQVFSETIFPETDFSDTGFLNTGFSERGFLERGFSDTGFSNTRFLNTGFSETGFQIHVFRLQVFQIQVFQVRAFQLTC